MAWIPTEWWLDERLGEYQIQRTDDTNWEDDKYYVRYWGDWIEDPETFECHTLAEAKRWCEAHRANREAAKVEGGGS